MAHRHRCTGMLSLPDTCWHAVLSSRPPQAKGRTGEAIGRLCQLAPPTALLLELDASGALTGGEREVSTSLLHRGDLF